MSAIELSKSLSKLMVPIILYEKFCSLTFITSIKVIYMTTHSDKSNRLRKTYSRAKVCAQWRILKPPGSLLATGRSKAVVFSCSSTKCFGSWCFVP